MFRSVARSRRSGRSRRSRLGAGALAAAAVLAVSASTAAADGTHDAHRGGAVYTLSNAPSGNAVIAFDRAADGSLTESGTTPTGGVGTGAGLGSQGALALDGDHLFAVNAGSGSISELRVGRDGVQLESVVDSGGTMPVSVAVRHHVLFVLNAGGTPNVTGFVVAAHGLVRLPWSTQPLSAGAAGPAQVAYSADGRSLIVTEKASNTIDTFRVGPFGKLGQAVTTHSAGATPFGFAVDRRGDVLVSEAGGSASSYSLDRSGALDVISAAVPTGNAAPCWLAVTPDSRFAYTANGGAGTISGFSVGRDGSLTLLDADGVSASFGPTSHPLDEAITDDGRFLYNLTDGLHVISALRIATDGSLTTVGTSTPLPVGAAGIVAD